MGFLGQPTQSWQTHKLINHSKTVFFFSLRLRVLFLSLFLFLLLLLPLQMKPYSSTEHVKEANWTLADVQKGAPGALALELLFPSVSPFRGP